jgi:hypothetical protein
MSEVVLLGGSLIGGALYLQHRPSRARLWYLLAAWATSNGDAAVERSRRRAEYVREAKERSNA